MKPVLVKCEILNNVSPEETDIKFNLEEHKLVVEPRTLKLKLGSHGKKRRMRMKFRKRPVVVDAVQLQCEEQRPYKDNGEIRVKPEYWPFKETPDWLVEAMKNLIIYPRYAYESDFFHMEIATLEGKMIVSPNDWIIKGVNGELYPCKPDIFEKTYEPMKEDSPCTN